VTELSVQAAVGTMVGRGQAAGQGGGRGGVGLHRRRKGRHTGTRWRNLIICETTKRVGEEGVEPLRMLSFWFGKKRGLNPRSEQGVGKEWRGSLEQEGRARKTKDKVKRGHTRRLGRTGQKDGYKARRSKSSGIGKGEHSGRKIMQKRAPGCVDLSISGAR